jgi:peptidase M48-like protein/PD-(D/E)XK nuclease superfamily protein
MLTELPGITGLLALIAVMPAVVRWWHGRTLQRRAADPALPERLLAARRRNSAIMVIAFALLIALSTGASPWGFPLLALSSVIASYPLRRTLFGETWSLQAYVWFVTRLFIGVWGFWIVLATMPMLSSAAGSVGSLVALAIAAVLFIWNARYAEIFQFLVRARSIEDPVLVSRFNALVRTSGIAMPRFERVDLNGGFLANAIALPSIRRSSVIFTETLLDRLEADETVAVCAHELAHLEHFNPRYLRRTNLPIESCRSPRRTVASPRSPSTAPVLPSSFTWRSEVLPGAIRTDVALRQLVTYLKLHDSRVGLLLNFGARSMREGLKRVVNDFPADARLCPSAASAFKALGCVLGRPAIAACLP